MIQVASTLDMLHGTKFEPASMAQYAMLNSPAELIMFGGAAGSLKSQTMLVDATQYYRRRNYNAIIFRKTLDELNFLIDRARDLYVNGLGAKYNEQKKTFKWPWGAQIRFTYLENDKDVFRLQGPEYQFVGFDESTHFMEFQVRYLINSRMRSIDGIPLKIRLATNPGNVGHDWHMRVFMGKDYRVAPVCVHCMLNDNSRVPYMIYPVNDAKWPSDGKGIGYTTQFIPGRVSDHNFYGPQGIDYRKRLAGLPDALADALMNGCWAAFEGQFFNTWDEKRMVVPYSSIKPGPGWPFWVGIDYGFGHLAAAYLFTKSPSGVVYILEGHEGKRVKAAKFAQQLKEMWVDRYHPDPWFLSHELFADRGAEITMAEMMTNASDIGFSKAGKDPVGRAMIMYSMLDDGQLLLSDHESVVPLHNAIQTRIHDDKNPDQVKKVDGDPGDDRYDAAGHGLQAYVDEPKDIEESLEDRAAKGRTDPTEIMLQWQILKGKEAYKNQPLYYRRGRLRGN